MARSSGYETGDLPDSAVHILLALGQPRHGYAVMAFLEEQHSGLQMGPATLYTTLKNLLKAGLIEELPEQGTRRTYRRTPLGTTQLTATIERHRQLVTLADTILEPR